MSSSHRSWRAQDLTAAPWRNGGGATYEIACEPPGAPLDDFDWRVSMATVETSGPFSTFAGVDRVIALIEGASMLLTIDGAPATLLPLRPLPFAGESRTSCELPDGPTRDLNVMTRRGAVSATLEFLTAPADVAGSWRTVLIAVSGRLEVDGMTLDPLDGVVRTEGRLAVRGTGSFALVRLSPTPA